MVDIVTSFGPGLFLTLVAAAVVVGFSKTSFGGIAAVAVAIFAFAMPAKESTATVLLLLIAGDLLAVFRYRTVSWQLLGRLIPTVIVGLLLGAWFMSRVSDDVMGKAIGAVLLVMVLLTLARRGKTTERPKGDPNWLMAGVTGIAAGFTTMTANAAGPVMALYFLAAGVDKERFVGTNAWFFFIINICKVPLAASMGLFTTRGLTLDLILLPAVVLGAWLGTLVIKRVTQNQFEVVTMIASAVSAAVLLVR